MRTILAVAACAAIIVGCQSQEAGVPAGRQGKAIRWDCDALTAEFKKWNKVGEKELPGLTHRREAEISPCYIREKEK